MDGKKNQMTRVTLTQIDDECYEQESVGKMMKKISENYPLRDLTLFTMFTSNKCLNWIFLRLFVLSKSLMGHLVYVIEEEG